MVSERFKEKKEIIVIYLIHLTIFGGGWILVIDVEIINTQFYLRITAGGN